MRIGLYLGEGGPRQGGAHTFVQDIVSALLATTTEHRWVLLTKSRSASMIDIPADTESWYVGWKGRDPLPVRTLSAVRRAWQVLRAAPRPGASDVPVWEREAIKASAVDFVVALSPGFYPGPDVPFLSVVWDLQHRVQPFFPEVSAGVEWDERETMYRRSLPRATFVVTGTETGAMEVRDAYGLSGRRVRVVPLPTPTWALGNGGSTADEPGVQLDVPRPFLLYPAQFWPHKNHLRLVRALAKLLSQGRTIGLVLCGSDKGTQSFVQSEVARLGIDHAVAFRGFVSQAELLTLYRSATALVFPSLFGPDNLPPLEAMALGCPVLAARVEGSEEQLGEAAMFFDPLQEDDIAEKIARLMDGPELADSLVRRGRQLVTARTASRYAAQILTLIEEFAAYRRCWPDSSSTASTT